ncbi:DUF6471 domain-containing protein [Pandoraea apista]|uniref:DUF6471 domain-containing protein n=1 Tax=Pandoraea apista TaxID=93218 RepID=UPI00248E1A39|nr:DUF6471 domain-containing protein [Pandoraea apista]
MLASRAARVVLARKGMTLEGVARAFVGAGFDESLRSVDGKIQRGSFQCAFFLQLLYVCGDEMPSQWAECAAQERDWFAASRAIYFYELASVTPGGLSKVMRQASAREGAFDASNHGDELISGEFSFTRLIMLACDAPVPSLDRFLDRRDVLAAMTSHLS